MSLSRRIPTPLMVATIGGSNPFPSKPFFVAATFPHDTVIKKQVAGDAKKTNCATGTINVSALTSVIPSRSSASETQRQHQHNP